MITFWNWLMAAIANHEVACIFVGMIFIASLPKPGEPWTMYEFVYTFLNGISANLPQKVRLPLVNISESKTNNSTNGGTQTSSLKETHETIAPIVMTDTIGMPEAK